jgi:hypothetical protein
MRSQVVVLVSFLSILLINCSKKESQEIQPTISDITESVYASGVIKAKLNNVYLIIIFFIIFGL